jgi:hypothetical protein
MLVLNIIGLRYLEQIGGFGHSLFLWAVVNHWVMVFIGLQIKKKKRDYLKQVQVQIEELQILLIKTKTVLLQETIQITIDQVRNNYVDK